jgi:hypothetical protein
MIRGGFLTGEDRGKLVALARDGSAAARVTRRANALVLLDGGWSCQEVASKLSRFRTFAPLHKRWLDCDDARRTYRPSNKKSAILNAVVILRQI